MLLSENIRRVGMEPREGVIVEGAVSVGARIGGTVQRWNGRAVGPGPGQSASWAGPLVSLECGQCWVQACWRWMQLDSLDAPTGRLFAIGLQSFICWTCINCDITEMPK